MVDKMSGKFTTGRNATERRMPLVAITDTTDGEGNGLIEVSDCLTRMNSRLYRQCRTYKVRFHLKPGLAFDSGATANMEFYTLPNTYFVHGAIKYAYDRYMQGLQDEKEAGIKPARWHDFKINEQNPDGVWEYLRPTLWDGNGDSSTGWDLISADEAISDASLVNNAGTSFGFHCFGNLANSWNIFREYAKKLNYRPQPGTTSSDQPYEGLLDLEDADTLAERGDAAPYDRDWSGWIPDDTTVDDDQGHSILTHQGSLSYDGQSGAPNTSTPYFHAPLGLVFVRAYSSGSEWAIATTNPHIILEAAPGNYNGVESHSLSK